MLAFLFPPSGTPQPPRSKFKEIESSYLFQCPSSQDSLCNCLRISPIPTQIPGHRTSVQLWEHLHQMVYLCGVYSGGAVGGRRGVARRSRFEKPSHDEDSNC